MISFNKPENLNGAELKQELNAGGVFISDDIWSVQDDANGLIWLDIAKSDKDAAETIVAAHNGTI